MSNKYELNYIHKRQKLKFQVSVIKICIKALLCKYTTKCNYQ